MPPLWIRVELTPDERPQIEIGRSVDEGYFDLRVFCKRFHRIASGLAIVNDRCYAWW